MVADGDDDAWWSHAALSIWFGMLSNIVALRPSIPLYHDRGSVLFSFADDCLHVSVRRRVAARGFLQLVAPGHRRFRRLNHLDFSCFIV